MSQKSSENFTAKMRAKTVAVERDNEALKVSSATIYVFDGNKCSSTRPLTPTASKIVFIIMRDT